MMRPTAVQQAFKPSQASRERPHPSPPTLRVDPPGAIVLHFICHMFKERYERTFSLTDLRKAMVMMVGMLSKQSKGFSDLNCGAMRCEVNDTIRLAVNAGILTVKDDICHCEYGACKVATEAVEDCLDVEAIALLDTLAEKVYSKIFMM